MEHTRSHFLALGVKIHLAQTNNLIFVLNMGWAECKRYESKYHTHCVSSPNICVYFRIIKNHNVFFQFIWWGLNRKNCVWYFNVRWILKCVCTHVPLEITNYVYLCSMRHHKNYHEITMEISCIWMEIITSTIGGRVSLNYYHLYWCAKLPHFH